MVFCGYLKQEKLMKSLLFINKIFFFERKLRGLGMALTTTSSERYRRYWTSFETWFA